MGALHNPIAVALAGLVLIVLGLAAVATNTYLLDRDEARNRGLRWLTYCGGVAVLTAVAGMHYTVTAAVDALSTHLPAAQETELGPRSMLLWSGLAAAGFFAIALAASVVALRFKAMLASLKHEVDERLRAEKALQHSKLLFRSVIDNLPAHLTVKDTEGRYLLVSKSYGEWWDRGTDEIIGKKADDLLDDVLEAEKLKATERRVLETGEVVEKEVEVNKNGRPYNWLLIKFPIKGPDNSAEAIGTVAVDITERKHAEDLIQEQREQLDQILRHVPEAVVTTDAEGTIKTFNPSAERTFGLSSAEAVGRNVKLLVPERHRTAHDAHIEKVRDNLSPNSISPRQVAGQHEDGTEFPMELSVAKMGPDGTRGLVYVARDTTEQRRIEAHIAHLAHHDPLTGLPNRVMFRKRIEERVESARCGESFALLYLDLDGLKGVNDTLGHPVGDELLKLVAGRLRDCVGEHDMVARLGGDEFAIIQVSNDPPLNARALAERICSAMGAPFDLQNHQTVIGTSIGIAVAPRDGAETDQLLNHADMALYRAKSDGRGSYRFFAVEMEASIREAHALGLDLRKGIGNDELEVHYQPIIDLETSAVAGFEALLRWHHPERGLVSPAEFIPIAEKIGLINQLGDWVLRKACAAAVGWPDKIRIAVNVSPAQLKGGGLVPAVIGALSETALPAGRLELEITESALLHDDKMTLDTLHQLRQLGIGISLDDFGTGYSSLSYLRSFPFDKIKIDQSFIRNLSDGDGERDDGIYIVQAIVGFASNLGVATVAEGVETEAQLKIVRNKGCTEAQGFLFSRPKPLADIPRILNRFGKSMESAA